MARQPQAESPLDIAIVGMAGRFPGAASPAAFWDNLIAGVESITRLSDEGLLAGYSRAPLDDAQYVRAGGVLADYEMFDAAFFGITPREADVVDPQQRLFLECAWEALEDAGYGAPAHRGRVGVFAGSGPNNYWLALQRHPELLAALGFHVIRLANDKDFLSLRVAYKLDLRGPAVVVQTACSTSLAAVHLACASLRGGECDMALAGASAILTYGSGYRYQEGGIHSPDGHCRVFDAAAEGTVPGDGAGVVLLRPLADARREGDHVYAVIKGSAMNNDGATKLSYAAPSVSGQVEVIRRARAIAGRVDVSPGYIEAHGTGTELGDLVEIAALTEAFETDGAAGPTRIGSVKSNIGHLDAAAGVVGLIKTALSLRHGWLPPTLHVERPSPRIGLDRGPFVVNTSLTRWEASETARRAEVSAFGIGGTNVHVVLEEHREPHTRAPRGRSHELLTLSAPTVERLGAVRERLAAYLQANPTLRLRDVAYTLQAGRQTFACREAIVCSDIAQATAALAARGNERSVTAPERNDGETVAFLFPGQGAQDGEMGAELYRCEPSFRRQIDACARILMPLVGYDLSQVLYGTPGGADLRQTSTLQLALFAVESALAATWMHWGIRPAVMLGHSVGEYTAAYLAGVFSLEDVLAVLAVRGRLLDALPPGAMTAVLLPAEEVRTWLGADLSLAAINADRQCVVSGAVAAIERFEREMSAAGVMTMRLQTTRAFHSAMVEPVLDQFADAFRTATLRPPTMPFVSSVTGEAIGADEACDPGYWVRHLRDTVQFDRALRHLADEPGRVLLEVGPGRTLTSLARLVLGGEVSTVASLRSDVVSGGGGPLQHALGRLWMAGIGVDWAAVHRAVRSRRVPLPTYPFARRRHWIPGAPTLTAALTSTAPAARVTKQPHLSSWFYVAGWTPAAPVGMSPRPRRIVLFDDATELGRALIAQWRAAGHTVVAVQAGATFSSRETALFDVNPDAPVDYRRLWQHIGAVDEIVHLWNATPEREQGEDARCFARALILAQTMAVAAVDRPIRITFVGRYFARVTPEDEVRADRAAVLGLSRVLPQEQPAMVCRTVDIGGPLAGNAQERLVAALATECLSATRDRFVALRGATRWIEHFHPLALEGDLPGPSVFRTGGHYLIVGGLSRIGATLASRLVERHQARVVLTTRAVPGAQAGAGATSGDTAAARRRIRVAEALRTLERDGHVSIVVADPGSESEMRAVIDAAVASAGPLHGVIYAAGLVGPDMHAAVADMDAAHYERHFQAKARGVRVLDAVTAGLDLDFCIVNSSLASVLGGLGYGAYAAANLYADAVAGRRRHASTPWLTVNWDGWHFDTTADGTAAAARELTLSADEGARAFDLLASAIDVGQIVVSTGDLMSRLARSAGPAPSPASEPSIEVRHPHDTGTTSIDAVIAEEWQRVLGVERIAPDDSFFTIGGDSLLATQVVAALRQRFGVTIGIREFFERPTVAAVAAAVRRGIAAPAAAERVFTRASGGATGMEALVREVADISDEAAEAELRRVQSKTHMGSST